MSVIGDAFVDVHAKTDKFAGEAEGGMGKTLKHMAELAGGVFAVDKIVEFGKSTVEEFNKSQDAALKLNNSLANNQLLSGSLTGQYIDLAKSISKKTEADHISIESGEGVLAQFHLNSAQLSALTPLMVDYAQKTGQDIPSAASSLGRALLGQGRALKAIGINFKDLHDPTKNYDELMQGLQSHVAGFAEQQGKTLQGRTIELKHAFADLKEEIGAGLAPVLGRIVSFASATLIPVMERLGHEVGPVVQEGMHAIGDAFRFVERIWDDFTGGFGGKAFAITGPLKGVQGFFVNLGNSVYNVVHYITQTWDAFTVGFKGGDVYETGTRFQHIFFTIGQKVYELVQLFQREWPHIWAAIRPVFDWIEAHAKPILAGLAIAVGLLVAPWTTVTVAVIYAYTHFKIVRDIVADLTRYIQEGIGWLREHRAVMLALVGVVAVLGFGFVGLAGFLIYAYTHVKVFRDAIQAVGRFILTEVVPALITFGAFLKNTVLPALITVGLFILKQWEGIAKFAQAIWPRIETIIKAVAIAIGAVVFVVFKGIQLFWEVFHATIIRIVMAVWDQIKLTIETTIHLVEGIIHLVLDLITGHWSAAWNDLLGIVSTVWNYIGGTISNAMSIIGNVLGSLGGIILRGLEALPGLLLGWAVGLASLLLNAGISIVTGLWNGLVQAVPKVTKWFLDLPGVILGLLLTVDIWLLETGIRLLTGLFNGIVQYAPTVAAWLVGLPGRILGWVGDATSWLGGEAAKMWHGLVADFDAGWPVVSGWLINLPGKILSAVENFGGGALHWLEGVGMDVIHGLGNALVEAAQSLFGHIPYIGGKIVDLFKGALGSHSPSTISYQIGVDWMQGLINGIADHQGRVQDAIGGVGAAAGAGAGLSLQGLSPLQGTGGVVLIAAGAINVPVTVGAGADQAAAGAAGDAVRQGVTEALATLVDLHRQQTARG